MSKLEFALLLAGAALVAAALVSVFTPRPVAPGWYDTQTKGNR